MRHVKRRHGKLIDGNSQIGPMDSFVDSSIRKMEYSVDLMKTTSVTDEMIRESIENFIIAESEPFNIVESKFYLNMIKLCLMCKRNDVFLPKADAMKNGIMKRASKIHADLLEKLTAMQVDKFHCALDLWTSINGYTFLAITCHYINNDWELCEKLLSFQEKIDHSGEGMAELVMKVLKEANLTTKAGCITGDNASNNDKLCKSLQNLFKNDESVELDWKTHLIRCFPHIVNLAVQSFLSKFQKEKEDVDNSPNENEMDVSNLLRRVRFAVTKLRSSPEQRTMYEIQCDAAKLPKRMIPLDVKTRWNSTFHMLDVLCKQKKAFDYWLGTNPEVGKVNLGYLKLNESDWNLIENIRDYLRVF